ncbi:hypothetical protein FACS1894130_06290 [Spirochaetia bacterium]|nr:hypothetical protein FACS1894130_06290 [Spirochaetia bacterium]
MKVIIADDEVHICSLIKHEIRWDELGISFLGMFHNGNDVITQFEKEPADILICDIEMPGKTGIELFEHISVHYPRCKCIVISGFRNFEYARSAMSFGVNHYLLKPIDGEELNSVLKSIVENSVPSPVLPAFSEQTIRGGLIDYINSSSRKLTLTEINNRFRFHFKETEFLAIKTVFTDIDGNSDFLPKVITVFTKSIRTKLDDFCIDSEIFHLSLVSMLLVLNYPTSEMGVIRMMLEKALYDTLVTIGGLTQCKVYFGVGTPVRHVNALNDSVQTAGRIVNERFKEPDKQVFYSGDTPSAAARVYGLTHEEKHEIANLIESVDTAGITSWLAKYMEAKKTLLLENTQNVSSFFHEVVEILIGTLHDLDVLVEDRDVLVRRTDALLDNCNSLAAVRRSLTTVIGEQVTRHLAHKKQNMLVYVQQAKNYICKHYAEAISLETIADRLNISPVYLSLVFKSEAGMNYSKYLASVRIERSKELLRNCNMNLTQIANSVGYWSTNYFSNLFLKLTGLKPSEYRRLHQSDIGE